MTTNNEQFSMNKTDFIFGILSLGIAVKLLEHLTDDSADNLSNYILQQGLNQIDQLTPDYIEQIVERYLKAKSVKKDGVAQKEQFPINKIDFVLSTLSLGIAVQILESLTGDSIDNLSNYISQQALNQINQLTLDYLEQLVEKYFKTKPAEKDGVAQANISTTGEFKFNAIA